MIHSQLLAFVDKRDRRFGVRRGTEGPIWQSSLIYLTRFWDIWIHRLLNLKQDY